MLVVTENELVQCFAPEEEPYLTKKHFDTAEELAAAVSRSMGMSEEDIEAGLAARASQGTPAVRGPGRRRAPQSPTAKPTPGVFEGKGAASEARTPTPAKAKASTVQGWGRANVVVDNGTDDEDSDKEDAVLASQGPNSPEVVARRLHDQVLELERVQHERDEEARRGERGNGRTRPGPRGGQQGVETAFDDPPREPAPETEGKDGEKEEAKDGAKESDGGVSAFALAAANLLGGKK